MPIRLLTIRIATLKGFHIHPLTAVSAARLKAKEPSTSREFYTPLADSTGQAQAFNMKLNEMTQSGRGAANWRAHWIYR
jgi:hypothetical protein